MSATRDNSTPLIIYLIIEVIMAISHKQETHRRVTTGLIYSNECQ